MKRSRFSEEKIIGILKEHQAGLSAADLCRQHGINMAYKVRDSNSPADSSMAPNECCVWELAESIEKLREV